MNIFRLFRKFYFLYVYRLFKHVPDIMAIEIDGIEKYFVVHEPEMFYVISRFIVSGSKLDVFKLGIIKEIRLTCFGIEDGLLIGIDDSRIDGRLITIPQNAFKFRNKNIKIISYKDFIEKNI